MNGQSAVLTVGFQFPYGDIKGYSRDEDTDTVYIDAEITRTILGLQLGLTAQISEDGYVTLNVIPTLTKILEEVDVELPTSGISSQTISNPVIDIQELATTVRVKEGHSVVLAGLISKSKVSKHSGLPFLGSIPLIKYLFKNMSEEMETRELVILITPYIRKKG
jgi:type II secretory pathway component GspD/PulD (secretin)